MDSHSHELISIRMKDNIHAMMLIDLLDLIRRIHPDTDITLVMDNARYQRCCW